jgi:type I restriction enzyme R subunit
MREQQIEDDLINKLKELKYTYRDDIHDRISLEKNFKEKFEELNRVHLADSEFSRLKDQIITSDVFHAARTLRERNSFERDDGTPLFYTLVNIKDWCKNTF